MSIFARLYPEHDIVLLTVRGNVGGQEVEACVQAYASDMLFTPDTHVVIDLGANAQPGLDFHEGLVAACRHISEARDGHRPYLIGGVVRQEYQATILRTVADTIEREVESKFEMKIFEELPDALQWMSTVRAA